MRRLLSWSPSRRKSAAIRAFTPTPEPIVDLQADRVSSERGNEFGSFVAASPVVLFARARLGRETMAGGDR